MKQSNYHRSFALISTVVVIAAFMIGISMTVSLLSIGEAQTSFALFRGEDSLQFVEGCVEDALLKARSTSTFGDPVGTDVYINRPEGTCIITVISKIGSNPTTWTMDATTTVTTYNRTIQVVFNKSAIGIILTSWTEI